MKAAPLPEGLGGNVEASEGEDLLEFNCIEVST